ncbi:DNA alkylation repair protein [Candidatus Parcubacteria bacterium]|jgi:3-methyladenine DNA glycosylase AlkD|nr:DNA alkylation repair protein [Candidatus Parcubacteria bacterium]MBT3948683.1 DNA alkylation repair protein [Candidatus Parcubacteria bacterium]
MPYTKITKDLKKTANKEKAKLLMGFFKTGKGQYGEGDIFIGVTVPNIRKTVVEYYDETNFETIQKLLESGIHEYRLAALLMLVKKYETVNKVKTQNIASQQKIYNFYLKNTQYVNNWDLVDLTAPNIVGTYLLDKPKERNRLYTMAKSKDLWKKRIAILATFALIRNNETKDVLAISKILLKDKHDLIHKAVGWMLRELGKRVSQEKEEQFLKRHYKQMPRTMLRYAIERFEEKKRQSYLKGTV